MFASYRSHNLTLNLINTHYNSLILSFVSQDHEDGYGDSDSDSDIPDELKKDYIDELTGETQYRTGLRKLSARSKSRRQGPLITNTTLNVLRVMGELCRDDLCCYLYNL